MAEDKQIHTIKSVIFLSTFISACFNLITFNLDNSKYDLHQQVIIKYSVIICTVIDFLIILINYFSCNKKILLYDLAAKSLNGINSVILLHMIRNPIYYKYICFINITVMFVAYFYSIIELTDLNEKNNRFEI